MEFPKLEEYQKDVNPEKIGSEKEFLNHPMLWSASQTAVMNFLLIVDMDLLIDLSEGKFHDLFKLITDERENLNLVPCGKIRVIVSDFDYDC